MRWSLLAVAACAHPHAAPAPAPALAPVGACRAAPAAPSAALAEELADDALGQSIASVQVSGVPDVLAPGLVAALGSRRGDPLSAATVGRDLVFLDRLVIAARVTASAHLALDGVDLEYRIEPRGKIRHVTMHGNDPVLGELVRVEGTLDDPQRLARLRDHALDRWHREGYLDARIAIADDRGDVCIEAAPGPRYTIDHIAVTGAVALPAAEVVRRFARRAGTINAAGGIADASLFDASGNALVLAYRDLGYDAMSYSEHVDVDRAHARLVIHVAIDEGPRYRFGAVAIPWPEARALANAAGVVPGRPFSLLAIERALEQLRRWGTDHGVEVLLATSVLPTHAVDITFSAEAVSNRAP